MSTFSISARDYRAGDHGSVERLQGIYFHHFLVVDNHGKVAEFTRQDGQSSPSVQFGHVSAYKNNPCFKTAHNNVNVACAIAKASESVDNFAKHPKKYNFFTENCECFVNFCLYGTTTSNQAVNALAVLISSSSIVGSAAFEVAFAVKDIEKSIKDKKGGLITGRQNAEVITATVACGSSRVACIVAGATIGQILCPIPGLGGVVGAALGSVIGHAAGKTSSSLVSRAFRRKK